MFERAPKRSNNTRDYNKKAAIKNHPDKGGDSEKVDGGQECSGRKRISKYFATDKSKPKDEKEAQELPAKRKNPKDSEELQKPSKKCSFSTVFLAEDGLFDMIRASKPTKAPSQEESEKLVRVIGTQSKSPEKAGVKSIAKRLMQVAKAEGQVEIALEELAESVNGDRRMALNLLHYSPSQLLTMVTLGGSFLYLKG